MNTVVNASAEQILDQESTIQKNELPETVELDSMIVFPLTLHLKDISGKAPILSRFAEAALMSVFDHRSDDGEYWHYRLLPDSNPVRYLAGAVDMNRYMATLIHQFDLDQVQITAYAKTAIETMAKEDVTQAIAMFQLISALYRVLHETRPDVLSDGTYQHAIDMMDVMIEESHPALGVDDIATLISNDTLSTVATWDMIIAYNAPDLREDGEGGMESYGLSYANAFVHSSDVLRSLVSTKAIEQTANAITKSLLYGDKEKAASCISAFVDKSFISGIVDEGEREAVRFALLTAMAKEAGYRLVKDDIPAVEVEVPMVPYSKAGEFCVHFAVDKPCAMTEFESSILVEMCSTLYVDNNKRELRGTLLEAHQVEVSQGLWDKVLNGEGSVYIDNSAGYFLDQLFDREESNIEEGTYTAQDGDYHIYNRFNSPCDADD